MKAREDIAPPNKIGLPVFLFFACIANAAFLYRSVRDCLSTRGAHCVPRAGSLFLLVTALAQLVWVLPCFVQCLLYMFYHDTNQTGEVACDIQGYYSTASSFSSMLLGCLLALFTSVIVRLADDGNLGLVELAVKLASIACLVGPLLLALLPLLHVLEDSFRYADMGEGFCYLDFHQDGVAGFIAAVVLALVVGTVVFYCRALLNVGDGDGKLRGRQAMTVAVLLFAYLVSWILWPIGSFMGFSDSDFPRGIMISGGVLGHGQALWNPLFYGVWWRRYFMLQWVDSSSDSPAEATLAGPVDDEKPAEA